MHEIVFAYEKDSDTSDRLRHGSIDNIMFPMSVQGDDDLTLDMDDDNDGVDDEDDDVH